MRKMLFPILLLFLLIACEKDQVAPVDNEEANSTTVDLRANNTAMAQIDELVTFVEGLDILFGPKNSIMVQLRNIKKKVERGQTYVALDMLDGLITHLQGLATNGPVDAAIIEVLIEKVEWIRCEVDPDCVNPLAVQVNAPGGAYTLYVTLEDQILGYPFGTGVQWGGYAHDLSIGNKWPVSNAVLDFSGSSNTDAIVNDLNALGLGSTNFAAKVCAELYYLGHDDWYLPALGELKAMYEQLGSTAELRALNNFKGNFYWSSTETREVSAWTQYFLTGEQHYTQKRYAASSCRCARK